MFYISSKWQIYFWKEFLVTNKSSGCNYSSLTKETSHSASESSLKEMSLIMVMSWIPDGFWSRESPSLLYCNSLEKRAEYGIQNKPIPARTENIYEHSETNNLGGQCKSRGWRHLVTTSVSCGCPDKVEFSSKES